MSSKPGRNDPCPCGGGKKYKKCHGLPAHLDVERTTLLSHLAQRHRSSLAQHEAREFQRQEPQGLGRPIISTQVEDQRVVAVGNQVHYSKSWKTFHDFLRDYPRIALGEEWWREEVSRPPDERHRIVSWLVYGSEQATALARQRGGFGGGIPANGALLAYMHLAYDLYGLTHAIKVQQLLIDRIRTPQNFPGALYEVRVAAALLRAGFSLELEDETDRRITHVEFVATHLASGSRYSVEAKRREGAKLKVNRLLSRALTKQAAHARIVFIDTNDGRLDVHKYEEQEPLALVEVRQFLKLYELDPLGKTLPKAYVIATFSPEEHHLDKTDLPSGQLLWGFHIEAMRPGLRTLLEQVETRRRHAPVFELFRSMQEHRNIPATFDGEAAAFAGSPPLNRLQIGNRYVVPNADGTDVEAVLESAIVMPNQRVAMCVFLSGGRKRFLVQAPLTDEELRAHSEHPSTFFGVIDPNAGRKPAKTGLDWFDFLWESYKDTPKEKLLEFLRQAPDFNELAALSQEQLATQYCVRMAGNMAQDAARREARKSNEGDSPETAATN